MRNMQTNAQFPPKHAFDEIDRTLIAALRKDGRAPISKLAEIAGVSRGTAQNRLDRMLTSGALLGFTIRVRNDYETETIRAIMLVEVVGKSTSEIIRKLRGFPELESVHTTNGKWDLIVEIRTTNLTSFDRILRDVRMIDGVSHSETNLILSTV